MKLWIQQVSMVTVSVIYGERYIQVNLTVNMGDDFWEVVQ